MKTMFFGTIEMFSAASVVEVRWGRNQYAGSIRSGDGHVSTLHHKMHHLEIDICLDNIKDGPHNESAPQGRSLYTLE